MQYYYELFDDTIAEQKQGENHFPDDGEHQRHWNLDKSSDDAVKFLKEHYGDNLQVVYTDNPSEFGFNILFEGQEE